MNEQFLLNFEEYIILIVDDNPTNLGVIIDYLGEYGFDIMVAQDGAEALEKVQHTRPDLILLDIMMPGIDGFETCRRLKADEATRQIPVIFMTALASEEDKIRGFELGAVDYVTKPIQQREVLARIVTHLRIVAQARQLQAQTLKLQQQNEFLQVTTNDLEKSNGILSKLAAQLEAISHVGQQITSILDLDELLVEVITLIQAKFSYYCVSVWLFNERAKALVLQASAGSDSVNLIQPGIQISLSAPVSIILTVYQTGEDYLVNDVQDEANYLTLKELPNTRSELALPLRIGKNVLGVLDIQSDRVGDFDLDDRIVLQMLANQVAIAIRNAQLYSLVQQANANKDKFFSIVAHDLKGPFQPLMGMAELQITTANTLTPSEVAEMGQTMYHSAKNVYNLLENLLQWSRFQMGRMEYNPIQLNLRQIVDQTMQLLAANAKAKGIILWNEVAAVVVFADENMLNTVVRNLTNNALKFTSAGGSVRITANLPLETASLTEHRFVEIAVTDTGVGIKQADIDRLFRIDLHHSTTGTAKEHGTGLGLLLCHEMVGKNGGQIWVESEVGKGTAVKFTVPLVDFDATPLADAVFPTASGENESHLIKLMVFPPPQEMTILLNFAMEGDLVAIQKRVSRIEQLGEQYQPFVAKLRELAIGFEEQEIFNLLKQYSE